MREANIDFREISNVMEIDGDANDDDYDEEFDDNINISSTSELLHQINSTSPLMGNTHHIIDYFKLASNLRSGNIINAPFPYRTHQSSSQVAFHLTRNPSSK